MKSRESENSIEALTKRINDIHCNYNSEVGNFSPEVNIGCIHAHSMFDL
jgi:hypothetical protein